MANTRNMLNTQNVQGVPEKSRHPIAVSDISFYICLVDIRDGSSKPVYGGVDRLIIGTYSYAYLWYTM